LDKTNPSKSIVAKKVPEGVQSFGFEPMSGAFPLRKLGVVHVAYAEVGSLRNG
jgi:hypothetical protein